jgi:hypothetical protein
MQLIGILDTEFATPNGKYDNQKLVVIVGYAHTLHKLVQYSTVEPSKRDEMWYEWSIYVADVSR